MKWLYVLLIIGVVIALGVYWYNQNNLIAEAEAQETQNIVYATYGLWPTQDIQPGFGPEVCARVCDRRCILKYPESNIFTETILYPLTKARRACHDKCHIKYCNTKIS